MQRFCFVVVFILSLGTGLHAQSFSLDSSFQPFFNIRNSPNSGAVAKIWEDTTNGKTYIVGSFSFVTGQVFNTGFTIMNQNGSRDISYAGSSGLGFINIFPINDSILFLGKSGNFSKRNYNGNGTSTINNWRLNYLKTVKCAQGNNPFFFKNGASLMANGMGNPGSCKIINPPDTFPHRYIVKVDSLGLWDSTFTQDANSDPSGFIGYDSNRILVYGRPYSFNQYDGKVVDGLCRIYHDGRLDTTFSSPLLNDPNSFYFDVSPIEADGGFFVKGNFLLKGSSSTVHSLVRLHADGSLDTNFMNFSGPIDTNGLFGDVYTIAPTPDKGYLVGGLFNEYQGHPSNNIAKIDSTGKIETQYFTNRGPDSSHLTGNGYAPIGQILPSAYGGYYVVGDFLKWDNKPSQPIVRLKDLVVGLSENKQNRRALKIEVYPNPAKEQVNLRFAEVADVQQIRVYDLLGREQGIESEKRNNYEYFFNVSQLESGVYFFAIELRNGNKVSKKIIKQ